MANQIVVSAGAKVRNLDGVLTATSGVVSSVPLGAANGVATLDSGGKVPVSQLPSSVVTYLGTWNAATNTPTLVNGTGDAGDMYICNVAGTVNFGAGPVTFAVGDWVLYGSGTWQKSNGQNGTVTSVGASITGSAIGITGSPITTAGTLAFAFAGTSGQYINGAGNLVTFPTISAEAQRLITEVYNETGATLTKGTVVYINGGHGNLPTITKAIATGDATSAQTYGIVQTDITNMNNGYVVVIGSLGDLDTQAYANGTQLYLSSTVAGAWTSVKQYAPAHLVYVAIVTRSHPTQGVVEVRIQNGFEMDELHNVSAQSPLNNQGLFYNTSTSLWENKSIATALGYTPANDSLVVKLAGTQTITGSKTFNATLYGTDSEFSGSVLSPIFSVINGTKVVNLQSLATLNRDIYLPDASGTIALTSALANYVDLTTAQTIGGTKTFSDATKNNGGIFLQNASSSSLAGYMNLGGLTNGVKFTSGGGVSNSFTLPSATGYTFTFPSATGTIALTSDLTGGTVTSVAALTIGTSGTDLSSSVANSTTTPVITLNVPTASATNRGALSSADWTTFNNKQNALTNPVTGTGTTNYLPKFTGASTIGNSAITDDGTTVTLISRALSGTSATFSGNLRAAKLSLGTSTTTFPINVEDATQTNTYFTLFNIIGTAGATSGLRFGVANGTITAGNVAEIVARGLTAADAAMDFKVMYNYSLVNALTLGSNGAATFSSSVTAKGTGNYNGFIADNSSSATIGGGYYSACSFGVQRGIFGVAGAISGTTDNNIGIFAEGGLGIKFFVNGSGIASHIMTSGGNVGIGTTSPSSKLTVLKTITTNPGATGNAALSLGTAGSAGEYNLINFGYDAESWQPAYIGYLTTSGAASSNGALVFATRESTSNVQPTERMRITSAGVVQVASSGSLEVGYSAIQGVYKLDVNGTGRFSGQLTASTVNGGTSAIFLNTGAQNSNGIELRGGTGGTSVNWKLEKDNTIANAFQITPSTTNGGTTYTTPVLTIASTGAATFSIASGVYTAINITSPNTSVYYKLTPTGGDAYYLGAGVTQTNDFSIYNSTRSAPYLTITGGASGGNVLIGTTTNNTGLLQVNGTIYATGFYESSDIRFKNILETNPNINLSAIDVIKFTRKDKDTNQVRYGYSAQQVQSILPDAVTGTDFLNVNYLDVHTLKIAALEQEIKELKAKMN